MSYFSNDQLLLTYHKLLDNQEIKRNQLLEKILRVKQTRSNSGIVVITVLTKPYPCPGHCLYCPTEKNAPKSYLTDEPAVMRAVMCDYHPYQQTITRLKALRSVGHLTSKVSIRVVGGTWSYYPKRYQSWFISEIFRACNGAESNRGLADELQRQNESAKNRIVELSVETRQDYVDLEEIKHLRKLGVTKVELGVQSVCDEVLKINKRGHGTAETIRATKLLKDAGFKVSYQMMLNLPGSDPAKDKKMLASLFDDQAYLPDHLKIYPLALLKDTGVYKMYQQGEFHPYTKKELVDLLISIKEEIPEFCRIERVIRDIPAHHIVEGGTRTSNLRQVVFAEMEKSRKKCRCIRCREVRSDFQRSEKVKLFRFDYKSSEGLDIFLSYENADRSKLYSFLRLRIPSNYFSKTAHFFPALQNSGIIREIHTYGSQVGFHLRDSFSPQHRGYGKKLVSEAEKITRTEFGIRKIAVIAGVGVRGYFRSQGYDLIGTYMSKVLAE